MIGVYDSGLGGMMLLPNLLKQFPNEKFLYLGDRERAPYGNKSKAELEKIIALNHDFLRQEKITDLIYACNTLCSVVDFSKDEGFCKHDIISKTAAQIKLDADAKILVFATPLTIQMGRYEKELKRLGYHNIIAHPLTSLAKLIENFTDESIIEEYLASEFEKLPKDVDGIILGCTHFPIVQNIFKKYYPNAEIYDSNHLSYDLNLKNEGSKVIICSKKEKALDEFINKYVKIDYCYYEENCSNIR